MDATIHVIRCPLIDGRCWVRRCIVLHRHLVLHGHAGQPAHPEGDSLLVRFVPTYEVVERRHLRVVAPAETIRFRLLRFT